MARKSQRMPSAAEVKRSVKRWQKMSKTQKILYVVVLVVALVAMYLLDRPVEEAPLFVPEGSAFQIYYLDVGQADSALVVCDGKTMLIDGGNVDDADYVCSALEAAGVKSLDYVVCTHAHEDHVGALSGVLDAYSAGTVYCSVDEYTTKCFREFVESTQQQGKEVIIPIAGDSFDLGSSRVTVLGPLWDYEETNDQSIVLRIVYGGTSFMFTGDATKAAEEDMLSEGSVVRSTVLKVAHHSSDTSNGQPWLDAVDPQYAVISVGTDNDYGHPHDEGMERLEALNIPIYRTDTMGMVVCSSDGESVSFYTEKAVG